MNKTFKILKEIEAQSITEQYDLLCEAIGTLASVFQVAMIQQTMLGADENAVRKAIKDADEGIEEILIKCLEGM